MSTVIKRLAIIGGSGFIGTSLLNYFNNKGINCFIIPSNELKKNPIEATTYLIKNLHKEDTVIFLAAITPDKSKDHFQTFLKNIEIAKITCDALKNLACSRVIYFSSDAVYPYNNSIISEETMISPDSLYGIMHMAREKMFSETVEKGLLIIRPTQIYGSLDTHNSYGPCRMLRSAIKENKIYLFGEGSEIRDHIYIEDLIQLTWLLLRNNVCGVVNAVTGIAISFAKIANIVQSIIKKTEISYLPYINPPPFRNRTFDPSMIKKLFSTFHFTPIEHGMQQMYKKISVISV